MKQELVPIYIAVLLFSVVLHEVSHGLVAFWFGDSTAKRAGRLTLNPIAHIDLFGSIILPALMLISGSPVFLAWAKPVPINPRYFSNFRWGTFCVSAAGIVTNFVLGLIAALAIRFFEPTGLIGNILAIAAILNFALAMFNLLPIPPLDGFAAFGALINKAEEAEMFLAKLGMLSFVIIFMVILFLPIGQLISYSVFGLLNWIAS